MITQDVIEEFFLNMSYELRKENIPILNDYQYNFRDYPYSFDVFEEKEKEEEEDDSYEED